MEITLNRLKALSDRNRLRIVMSLKNHNELCACQLIELLQIKGGTVSRHLSILVQSHIIKSRKAGRWIFYSLDCKFSKSKFLNAIVNDVKQTDDVKRDKQKLKEITGNNVEELCRTQRGESCCPIHK